MPDVKSVVSREELDAVMETAKQSDQLICIDFWAPWCGPCRMMSSVVEEFSDKYQGRCIFLKIDVDKSETLAQFYSVKAMPTFVIIRGSERADELVGASKDKLELMLERNLRAAPQLSAAVA